MRSIAIALLLIIGLGGCAQYRTDQIKRDADAAQAFRQVLSFVETGKVKGELHIRIGRPLRGGLLEALVLEIPREDDQSIDVDRAFRFGWWQGWTMDSPIQIWGWFSFDFTTEDLINVSTTAPTD